MEVNGHTRFNLHELRRVVRNRNGFFETAINAIMAIFISK